MTDQWEKAAKQFKPDPNASSAGNEDWKIWQQGDNTASNAAEPSAIRNFVTSPHGYIREGARQVGQGARELFTSGQRMRGATDVLKGAASTLAPVAMGAALPALAAAPAATVGGMALGAAGAAGGGAAGRGAVKAFGGGPDAQELAETVGNIGGGALGGFAGSKAGPALTRLNPERAVNRIFRPSPSDSEFPEVAPQAFSDVKKFGGSTPQTFTGKPKVGVAELRPGGNTDAAIQAMQGQGLEPWLARARNMGVKIPGDEIVAATRKAIPDLMRVRDLQGAAALESQAQEAFGGKTFSPDQFRDWLKTENGTLRSFYNKPGVGQGAAEAAGTPTAIEKAQADAMRDTLYRHLDPEHGGAGPREIQQRTGNVITLRNAAERRSNAIMGEKPLTPAGAFAAPGMALIRALRGYPSEALGTLAHPFRGPSDALISNLYRQVPEGTALPQPPLFQPRALLEPGATRMPAIPDTSGPIRSIIPPNFGSSSMRLLPGASSQIGVSGTVTPDIIARGLRGTGQGLLPPPQPGQPPLNILPRGPGSIGPAGTVPLHSTETPIPGRGVLGGRLLQYLRRGARGPVDLTQ